MPENNAMPSGPFFAALISFVAVVGTDARAQWTVTRLNPTGAADSTQSAALAAHGAVQAGWAQFNGVTRASVWHGTAASRVDLNPPGWAQSIVFGVDDDVQVGFAGYWPGEERACLWRGTAASMVELWPPGSDHSRAYAAGDGQQAGYAFLVEYQDFHASLWTGTAASWVDLNPDPFGSSIAYAVGGGQQAGWVYTQDVVRASLWSGTAESWVDLHPAGFTRSVVWAIGGGQQAGFAEMVDGQSHAGVWRGTAASWVDLHPSASGGSMAYATNGVQQVGSAYGRASLWSGTADSWVDLGAFLPWEFVMSHATGISSDGVNTYITGEGYNVLANRNEALLWTRPLSCPADLDNDGDSTNGYMRDGAVDVNDLLAFLVGFEAGSSLVDLDNGTNTGTPDNAVDINDLLFFLTHFEEGC